MYGLLQPCQVSGKCSLKLPTAKMPINLFSCASQTHDTKMITALLQLTVT